MSEMPDIGKISPEIFNEVIYPRLGAKNDKIIGANLPLSSLRRLLWKRREQSF